ncbi:MAG: prepilin peptidase [Lachnospiraceae bacterium]|nr:prepilin peptidase [Lachnospiraceae bacterium]
MREAILLYITIFLFGIVFGSFMNVCIYRIPKKEDIVKTRSHCMSCGYVLKWYDLIPLFSYIFLGGKCRKCKTKLSAQYPLIEAANGLAWLIIVLINGVNVESLLYCVLTSALITLSVIDFRTYEIPLGINIFILAIGLVRLITDYSNWLSYLIGFFSVSVFLTILYYATGGRAIGGGDVKLMAVCGLVLGWKLTVLSFFLGCILGAIIHLMRMKISGESHVLAMGPYLSMGMVIAMLWGNQMINWYFQFL